MASSVQLVVATFRPRLDEVEVAPAISRSVN